MVPLHVAWLPLLIIDLIFSIFFLQITQSYPRVFLLRYEINMTQHYTLRTGNEIIEITKPS